VEEAFQAILATLTSPTPAQSERPVPMRGASQTRFIRIARASRSGSASAADGWVRRLNSRPVRRPVGVEPSSGHRGLRAWEPMARSSRLSVYFRA
jgi:hypothetical protein